jgi:TPR repeat protein
MTKTPSGSSQALKSRGNSLFFRADKKRNRGDLRSAFRLYLAAAKAGDEGSQLNVGYCYDKGFGTRPNRVAALYWYRRAYRRGDAGAANNIGTIWRDEQEPQRALSWFRRAVRLGDDGSNLEIAKLHLRKGSDPKKAIPYLEKVCASGRVTEGEMNEATALLKKTKARLRQQGLLRIH